MLNALEIFPNKIIDCTIGQVSGAYCDGRIDRQQALLISYHIAKYKNKKDMNQFDESFNEDLNQLCEILKNIVNGDNLTIRNFNEKSRLNSELNYGSSQYFKNTLSDSNHFNKSFDSVTPNTLLVTISPDEFKKPNINIKNIISFSKENEISLKNILSAIGQIYCIGLSPKFQKLFNPVTYPVCRGTPSISPLIVWDHSKDWFIPLYPKHLNINNDIVASVSNNPKTSVNIQTMKQ